MNIYQEQILDHYKNPRNSGKPQFNPTHSFKLQNLSCGDEVEIFLLIQGDKVTDVSFVAEGCSISVATSSMLSEEIKGMDIDSVKNLNIDNVLEILGIDLTMTRQKCALLPLEAVKKAVNNY